MGGALPRVAAGGGTVRVAVVGNGPSAAGKGAEIDAHDFVVRCNAFSLASAPDCGTKLSAWAWFAFPAVADRLGSAPGGDYCVWMTKPLAQWGCSDVVDPRLLIRWAAGRPIRWVTADFAKVAACALGAEPTTGFTAVDMAVRMLGASELTLYGFDATTPDRPGWGDARTVIPWQADYPHRQDLEKIAFTRLRDEAQWLGRSCGTRLAWKGACL